MSILTSILGMDGIPKAVTDISSTVTDLVKRFVPDPDKALEAKTAIDKALQDTLAEKYRAMADVMSADAKSDNWFTKITRPMMVWWSMTMVTAISALGYFNPTAAHSVIITLGQVPDQFFQMIAAGTGAYVIGRSTEKIATSITSVLKK